MTRKHPTTAEQDTEYRECIKCDAEYDLARQDYYGPHCPRCTRRLRDE